MVTLAGVVAGSLDNAAQYHFGKWGNSLSFVGMGAVFAVLVLGAAAWMYRGQFERRQWPRWLAAGGILAVGMPVSFFAAIFGALEFVGRMWPLFPTGRSGAFVEVGLGLLAASMVWSFAMTMALRVSLFSGIRRVSIFLICTAWMFAWIEFYFCVIGYVSSVWRLGGDFWLMLVGGQAISAMLIGYYLEKYGVGEASVSAALVGDSSDVDGRNAEI